jgi:hypothetical protein
MDAIRTCADGIGFAYLPKACGLQNGLHRLMRHGRLLR